MYEDGASIKDGEEAEEEEAMSTTPNFDDMSPKQVCEWGKSLLSHANQFGEIRATLIVNCQEGRALHNLGIKYDESASTLSNLVYILATLIDRVNK